MTSLHPELSPAARRWLLRQGVERFNRGELFDAHESWEVVWRSTTPEPRDLWQGLIQVAVGLYHWLDRGRAGPARRVLARGRRRLERAPAHCGLDLAALCTAAREWEAWLAAEEAGEAHRAAPPPRPRIVVVDAAELG